MENNLSEREVNQYSSLTLAFLGDSVYEVLVRRKILMAANLPTAKLHNIKIRKVCAAYQSSAVDVILPLLSEKEEAVLKRGRNATGNTVPKHSNAVEYRRATALECLFGYLYLLNKNERIDELFQVIWDMEELVI